LDYPILEDLIKEGMTDYVAMPLHFSDGHINALTLATDRPGGFTTSDLGQIYEALPLLSRLFEVHALKRTTKSLMTTYLGERTSDLVLGGKIKRGDGESVPAVIFYADLRGSTALAAELGRKDYLRSLNAFFEAVAGQVMEEGGEVLKFIGDAVLAIFPITECEIRTSAACQSALNAALGALRQIEGLQAEFDLPRPLTAGIALHKGEVTYGNVGSRQRLDFTVVGSAANEVARIADLCKVLQRPLLFSGKVAPYLEQETRSLGEHELRGTSKSHEIFTLLSQD
ncbi:MAG: adenylate/guanylate cyclase domain-containing protein, partial [Kiloniellales bacterium]|nr:adenylate/guanylate cyclase domain-containing protein [Kiloniellales bacterium]